MSLKTITRTQSEAIRTAELAKHNGAPSGDVLAGHYLISATTPTAAVLVRLGLAENIVVTSAGTEYVFPVLTEVGEMAREWIERAGVPIRLSMIKTLHEMAAFKNAPKPFTVVMDWASDMFDAECDHLQVDEEPQIFRVLAATGSDACDEADRLAVEMWGEEAAGYLKNVAVFQDHVLSATD